MLPKGIYHPLVVLMLVLRVSNIQVTHNRQAKDQQEAEVIVKEIRHISRMQHSRAAKHKQKIAVATYLSAR
jgi:hypothetical protein